MTSAPVYPPTGLQAPPLFPGEVAPSLLVPEHFRTIQVATDKDTATRKVRPTLETLRRYPYLVANDNATEWTLTVDIDRDSALMDVMDRVAQAVIPAPTWLVERGATGRGHAVWAIERVPHGAASHLAPQQFASDVRQALTNELGGDPAWTWSNRTLNPWWKGWKAEGVVLWGPARLWTLGELKAVLVASGSYDPRRPHRWTPRDTEGYAGRNEELFHRVRNRPASAGTPYQAAVRLNAGPNPLPAREERSVARSVARYEASGRRRSGGATMSTQERQRQAERGAKGGKAGTPAQRAARARGPAAAAVVRSAEAVGREAQVRDLYASGLTRAQIMASTGYGRTLVYGALRGL